MKSKLFLGIILIITIISSMIMTVTEGACNYNDGGGIGGSGGESWTKKCYGLISGSGACKKDFGDGWDFACKEKKCKNGGFDAHYLCKKKGGGPGSEGSSGAPVTGRTSEACGEAGIYENEERLKQAESKLNELKKIAAKVNQGIGMKGNRKGIFDNLRMAKELASAGGDGDGSDENPACVVFPSACGSDNDGFPTIPTDANYQASLRG